MTQLEQRALSLAITALRKYIGDEIDWEQRRYEIAREILANNPINPSEAVALADQLIKELRN